MSSDAQDADRLARVALSRCTEPGDLITASLVQQLGAVDAWQALRTPRARSQLHVRLMQVEPERELHQAARLGIRFVIPGDDEWPTSLDDLSLSSVEVQGMGGTPVGLWVRGPMPLTQLDRSVSVVGSREASVYGAEVTREMCAVIAQSGHRVVSGAAVGIDEEAHSAAILAGGATAAVLARGLDRPYPKENKELITQLWNEFAVISEVPPGSSPTRIRFLSRNRIIAALSRGTLLVEAALRSGALNTVHWTDGLSRPVMCVPGPITSPSSAGVHQWMRRGGATLVTHGSEVLEVIGDHGDHLVPVPRAPESPRDRLTLVEKRVLEAVPLTSGATVDSIAHVAALHIRDADAALRRLRGMGFVATTPKGWHQRGMD